MAPTLGELSPKVTERVEYIKVCEISVILPGEMGGIGTILGRMYKKGGADCETLATVTA